ncbi:hypothetical protein [Ferrovibrio sp.]|uniref:hypothetical protein n=1 Tax=Ferrovibrio sp. TaxID=1917215 RepID=UPI00311FFF6E
MARRILETDFGVALLLVDSITEISAADAGWIVLSGSHGGRSAASYAAAVPLALCIFNDAGIGKEEAGIAGLRLLDYPAAACSHLTARIGDPQDAWENGVISTVNAAAKRCGLSSGVPLPVLVRRLAGTV